MLWYFQGLILTRTGRVLDRAGSLTEAALQWPGVSVVLGHPQAVTS